MAGPGAPRAPRTARGVGVAWRIVTVESGSGQSASGQRGSGQPGSGPDPFAGFGPNEWLVYEMYQQYLKDPESVDKAWWDFFADYQPADTGATATTSTTSTNGSSTKPSTDASANAPTPAPSDSKDAEKGATKPASSDGSEPRAASAAEAPGRASGIGANGATERGTSEGESAPQPRREPAAQTPTPQTAQLRGAAARVVSNMEASLTVPTATSVRAIPAKLLIDNRVVINNHLRRGRGGKVSSPPLIASALARALAESPVMTPPFTTTDGKPAVTSPDHVNLGLAID